MNDTFTPIDNRDAWATIRGFAYQFDITLLRWIALDPTQLLELERGEDVDIISAGFAAANPVRELEQIKHRETSFTLNQAWVMEMLVTFFQHQHNNPQQELLFRYVTNADYTTESPTLFTDKTSGVAAWMALVNQPELTSADYRVEGLQQHLRQRLQTQLGSQAADKQALWQAFATCVEDREELLRFIRRVEWSTRQGGHESLSQQVKDELQAAGLAANADSAELLYARLFLYIAKLLGCKGVKQLSHPELQIQAQLPLSTADKQALSLVHQLLGEIEGRLGQLEAATTRTAGQLTKLTGEVDLLRQAGTVFDYRLATPIGTPPVLVRDGTRRATKVAALWQRLRAGQWVHIAGTQGSGKSQLAALVAHGQSEVYWLDLRDYQDSVEKTCLVVEAFWQAVNGSPALTHPLLILDDLPLIEPSSALENQLARLAATVTQQGGYLLSTSHANLPPSTAQLLVAGACYGYDQLDFTNEEITECLTNRGLETQNVELTEFVALLTHRNPTLVGDLLRYWQTLPPSTDSQRLFDGVFEGKFSAATLATAQRAITKTITDPAVKQLLYRLSGISWGFRFEQVQAVSAVSSTINAPYEAFQQLLNRWIRPVDDVYYVSPLLRQLGERNLLTQEAQEVHVALAKSLLTKQPIDLLAATYSFTEFCKGHEYTSAGVLLLGVYQATQSAEQARLLSLSSLLVVWAQVDMPASMSLPLRAFTRHEQSRLHRLLGNDTTIYQGWLAHYAAETEAPLAEQVLAKALWLVNFDVEEVPAQFWPTLAFVIRNRRELHEVADESVSIPNLASLFWLPIRSLNTSESLGQWLELAGLLREELGLVVWEEEIAQTAVTLVSRQLAAAVTTTNANSLLVIFEEMVAYFTSQQQPLLQAIVLATSVPLYFQVAGYRPGITAQLAAIAASLTDSQARYLLYAALGKFLFTPDNPADSVEWLNKAVALPGEQQDNFVETLVYAAAANSHRDRAEALRLGSQATELVLGNETLSALERVQVLAEEALAYWLHDDSPQSFSRFENVVNQLLDLQGEAPTPAWMRQYVLLRHALGYIAPATARERVPEWVADGSEYVVPFQGFFTFNTRDLSDLYQAQPAPYLLFYLMAVFAEGVGHDTKASEWARRAFEAARQSDGDTGRIMMASLCGAHLFSTGHFEEAFEAGLLSAAIRAYVAQQGGSMKVAMNSIDVAALYTNKPSSLWEQAEDDCVTYVIVPMLALTLTAQITNPARGAELARACEQVLTSYLPQASNQAKWTTVCNLSRQVLLPATTGRHLLQQADAYKLSSQQPLQVLCLLGAIARSTEGEVQLIQLLSILPYLTTCYSMTPALIKFVLVPFTRQIGQEVLKRCYVGSRAELAALLDELKAVSLTDTNAVQKILRPVVKSAELTMPANTTMWLYQHD